MVNKSAQTSGALTSNCHIPLFYPQVNLAQVSKLCLYRDKLLIAEVRIPSVLTYGFAYCSKRKLRDYWRVVAAFVYRLLIIRNDFPAAGRREHFPRMKFADSDAGVIRNVKERKFYKIVSVKSFTIKKICDECFQEYVVRHDAHLARALAREKIQAFAPAFL